MAYKYSDPPFFTRPSAQKVGGFGASLPKGELGWGIRKQSAWRGKKQQKPAEVDNWCCVCTPPPMSTDKRCKAQGQAQSSSGLSIYLPIYLHIYIYMYVCI